MRRWERHRAIAAEAEGVAPAAAAEAKPDKVEITLPQDFRSVALTGIFVLMMLYTLYFAAEIFVPICLAVMFRLYLQLPMNALIRLRVPAFLSAFIVIACLFGGLALLGIALSQPANDFIAHAPQQFDKMEQRLAFLRLPFARLQDAAQRVEHMADAKPATPVVAVAGPGVGDFLTTNTQVLVRGLGTVLVLVFFLLMAGDTFRRKLVEILPRLSDKKRAVEIINEIENNVSRYLLTISAINGGLGFLTGVAFYFCGMGSPILWGAVAFAFNFIPIIGPFCASILFLFVGLLTFDNNGLALLPVGIYLGLILVEGQIVTPMVLMRRFQLNPVAIIIALIFWFWMWGVPGAFLAVPLLAVIKIVCDHVRPLTAIGHLLEG